MPKYVKLSDDRTEWKSALFSQKPPQIRRFDDSEIHHHDWFVVVENRAEAKDRELFREEIDRWEVVNNQVHVYYKNVPKDIETRREVMCRRCTEFRDQRLNSGLTFNGYRLDSGPETYKRVIGAVLSTVLDPNYSTDWITEDNEAILLAQADIVALGQAFEAFERTHVMECRLKKDSIMASLDPENFDVTAGWPTNEFTGP